MKSEGNLWGIYILSNELIDNWSAFIDLFLGAYLDLRIIFNVHMVIQHKSFYFSVFPSITPNKSYFHLLFLIFYFHIKKEYEPAKENSLCQTHEIGNKTFLMAEKDTPWHRKNRTEMFCSFFLSPHIPLNTLKHTLTPSLAVPFCPWREVRNWKGKVYVEWVGVGWGGHLWGFLETSFPACE